MFCFYKKHSPFGQDHFYFKQLFAAPGAGVGYSHTNDLGGGGMTWLCSIKWKITSFTSGVVGAEERPGEGSVALKGKRL